MHFKRMTKLFANSLALCLILARSPAWADTERCCLCDYCKDVAPTKVDLLTLSPFRPGQPSTCDEIAFELLDLAEEGSEKCAAVRLGYQIACCSAEFDEDLTKSYVGAARELWNAYGVSRSSGSQTIARNGVRYNTVGGNVSCDICHENPVKPMEYATVHDLSRGTTVQGSCSQIVSQFMSGDFSNNMCKISQLRLKPACCPEGSIASEGNAWRYRPGGR